MSNIRKIDKFNRPLLRPVSFEEAYNLSPWPGRLTGKEQWTKKVRNVEAVLAEYDRVLYAPLAERWARFRNDLPHQPSLKDTLSFSRLIDKLNCQAVEENFEIYRSRIDEYLVSSGDQLFAGSLPAALGIHNWVIDSQLESLITESPVEALVELGCGNGQHVFRSLARQNIKSVRGGDISPVVTKLLKEMASDIQASADFCEFNYYEPSTYSEITNGLQNYIIYTCHSIEQIPNVCGHLIDSILKLQNRPKLVVHFEPVQFDEDHEPFDSYCKKYAELNNYNQDLWKELRLAESNGRLRIVSATKRVWGISAFNPTSIVAWQPL